LALFHLNVHWHDVCIFQAIIFQATTSAMMLWLCALVVVVYVVVCKSTSMDYLAKVRPLFPRPHPYTPFPPLLFPSASHTSFLPTISHTSFPFSPQVGVSSAQSHLVVRDRLFACPHLVQGRVVRA
jgi:hypothetical protein